MDLISAAQWLDEAMTARSYLKTRNLEEIAKRDPQIAEQIEQLCKAVLALRGFALVQEANGVLSYAAKATAPFVTAADAFDEQQRLKGMARLPAELRPEEIAEYKRIARFNKAEIALAKIIARRGA